MTFIVILAALAVQYYLQFYSQQFQYPWFAQYYTWLEARIAAISKGHGLFAFLIVIIPILLLTNIVFALIYHVLTVLVYTVVSAILFWYYLDMRDLQSASSMLRKVFAPIFWFALGGPTGLMLYVSVLMLLLGGDILSHDKQVVR